MSNFWGPFFHIFGVKKNLKIFWTWKSEKTGFFRANIWVEFECKYMKVGNRLLLAILWLEDPLYLFWEAWGFSFY